MTSNQEYKVSLEVIGRKYYIRLNYNESGYLNPFGENQNSFYDFNGNKYIQVYFIHKLTTMFYEKNNSSISNKIELCNTSPRTINQLINSQDMTIIISDNSYSIGGSLGISKGGLSLRY